MGVVLRWTEGVAAGGVGLGGVAETGGTGLAGLTVTRWGVAGVLWV
ncbi:hypothetical protein SAMN06272771_5734 [Streptomyces sp. Ag82_O1-12]|nr:hypothetical protein SAMN06272771_5734 [Streptomyces sp. Ag82_O1-12]